MWGITSVDKLDPTPSRNRSWRARWAAGALAIMTGISTASVGWAQSGDAAAAEVLFTEGRKALDANRVEEACQKFAESERLEPAAGTLMNLATCEEKLGKLARAWQHWKEAIAVLRKDDDRVLFARGRVEDLERKLPRLTVVLSSGAALGVRVIRDDVELGPPSLGVALPVDPGPHTVTVQAPGRRTSTATVVVNHGDQKQIEVHAGEPVADEKPRTLGWVLGGVGVAGVAAAVGTGLILAGKKSVVERDCPDKACGTQAGLDAASSGKSWVVFNLAAWIAGGAGLGLGAYFLFSGAAPTPSTGLAIDVNRSGADVAWRGSF